MFNSGFNPLLEVQEVRRELVNYYIEHIVIRPNNASQPLPVCQHPRGEPGTRQKRYCNGVFAACYSSNLLLLLPLRLLLLNPKLPLFVPAAVRVAAATSATAAAAAADYH